MVLAGKKGLAPGGNKDRREGGWVECGCGIEREPGMGLRASQAD